MIESNRKEETTLTNAEFQLNEPQAAPEWLIRNFGPRCTLVCAASVLKKLGANSDRLVHIIEKAIGFSERFGPSALAYLNTKRSLARGIEAAALAGGIRVKARTRLVVRWQDIANSLDRDVPVVLNCFRAPGGRWRHSVLAVSYCAKTRSVMTLDPNDGQEHRMTWLRPNTGWVCTATYIELV